MAATIPTIAVVTICVSLVVLAVVGLFMVGRRPLIGVAIVAVALVGGLVVAGVNDNTTLALTIFLAVVALATGKFAESKVWAETPEPRRRLLKGLAIVAVILVAALVVVRDLAPRPTHELIWDTLRGDVEAALVLADVPDEELEAFFIRMGFEEQLASTVEVMASRETKAGRQERLRALSRRLADIASENASPGA